MRRERIKKVQCVFIIIVQNIKVEISTQNNFVKPFPEIILSSSDNLAMKSTAFALGGL